MRLQKNRRGTASVELAVCLPVIVAFVFGGIETVNAIFLKQGLTIAAYEAAKIASLRGGTQADAELRGNSVLSDRGFSGSNLTISPEVDSSTASGTKITVTATAPANANAIAPVMYYGNTTLRAEVSMVRN